MSDFIYSTSNQPAGLLKSTLCSIYTNDTPECTEYHGQWGSIAVVKNHYYGFEPFEDSNFIIFTTGGPVLNFPHHNYCKENSNNYKNQAILDKWKYKKNIRWDDDLSGPFVVICTNKKNNSIEIVTDLLLFIPVFHTTLKNSDGKVHIFGTHNDVVAKTALREKDIDFTSVADMMLNAAIVFPYTFHRDVLQLTPASTYTFDKNKRSLSFDTYWIPYETYSYKDIDEAAVHLRESLLSTVEKITHDFDKAALFLSGGEDSRVVLASIPKEIKKHAFIFLDSFNREGKIANKAAKCYGADLTIGYRTPTHYLDNMEATSSLIGSQFSFSQVHSYGFHKQFHFDKNPVVLDGILSDTFLKGYTIKSLKNFKLRKQVLFSTIIQTPNNGKDILAFKNTDLFEDSFIEEVRYRRETHYNMISCFRTISIKEWLKIWPITNLEGQVGLQGNHKLFRSYEPFTNANLVKIAATIPQDWKINRKLFHIAFKPLLKQSWHLAHGENAHFPYFGPYTNIPLKVIEAAKRKMLKYREQSLNQGPWCSWNNVVSMDIMKKKIQAYSPGYNYIRNIFKEDNIENLIEKKLLNAKQMLILLQTLYKFSSNVKYAVKEEEII